MNPASQCGCQWDKWRLPSSSPQMINMHRHICATLTRAQGARRNGQVVDGRYRPHAGSPRRCIPSAWGRSRRVSRPSPRTGLYDYREKYLPLRAYVAHVDATVSVRRRLFRLDKLKMSANYRSRRSPQMKRAACGCMGRFRGRCMWARRCSRTNTPMFIVGFIARLDAAA